MKTKTMLLPHDLELTRPRSLLPLALVLLVLLVGCGPEPDPQPDPGQGGARDPAAAGKADDGAAASTVQVAAVQYGAGQAGQVSSWCKSHAEPDLCAVITLAYQAWSKGADLVVTPEYALGQTYYEPAPYVGENPATSAYWPAEAYIAILAKIARQLQIYLVVDLLTYSKQGTGYAYHNTQVAFAPSGAVVGVHNKFNLFGSEKQSLTAGNDVTVFSTPLGRVGLLICADIYGSYTLLDKLVSTKQARVVALSSYWTVSGAVNWQKNFAKKHGVYMIAANTTTGPGYGGGVFDPTGQPLAQKVASVPSYVLATIPAP
jgi:predicted amidohydrolase